MRKQEKHVVLRLVSPRMFFSLWLLIILAISGGALVWSIQEPVLIQGKGLVVQTKTTGKTAPKIVVLLLFSPDQQSSLKAGQPVTITITNASMTFTSSIQTVEAGVMSPAAIGTQINVQLPLVQTLSGPAVVALAPVEPTAQAQTYLGSQCQVEVQIGSRSALSLLPGYSNADQLFRTARSFVQHI